MIAFPIFICFDLLSGFEGMDYWGSVFVLVIVLLGSSVAVYKSYIIQPISVTANEGVA